MIQKFFLWVSLFFLLPPHALIASEWFPEINGWTLEEDEHVYNSSDLWQLIDGAAEVFIDYNFLDLHLAEYTHDEQIIRVEIYRHGTPADSYGMYSSERMPDYQLVNVGAQGYSSEGIVNFFTGSCYVKVMNAGLGQIPDDILLTVAGKVDDLLDQSHQMPETLSLLPNQGRVYLSDTYIASNFIGYGFLHSAFTAKYDVDGNTFQLFVIKSTPEEVQNMINSYMALLKEDKFRQQGSLYIVDDMFNGRIFLSVQNNYLVGVLNTDNEELAADYVQMVTEKL
jgi:hypothetical protein